MNVDGASRDGYHCVLSASNQSRKNNLVSSMILDIKSAKYQYFEPHNHPYSMLGLN